MSYDYATCRGCALCIGNVVSSMQVLCRGGLRKNAAFVMQAKSLIRMAASPFCRERYVSACLMSRCMPVRARRDVEKVQGLP
jgi:hypothetical protein